MDQRFDEESVLFGEAASQVVDLGNGLIEANDEEDLWEIASGLLAGAVQFWLYTRSPCDSPSCQECEEIATSRQRLDLLLEETRLNAEESDYFHTPNDRDVGRA